MGKIKGGARKSFQSVSVPPLVPKCKRTSLWATGGSVLLWSIESWLCCSLCDSGQVSSLCLSFLIYKMEILMSSVAWGCQEDKWDDNLKYLNLCLTHKQLRNKCWPFFLLWVHMSQGFGLNFVLFSGFFCSLRQGDTRGWASVGGGTYSLWGCKSLWLF